MNVRCHPHLVRQLDRVGQQTACVDVGSGNLNSQWSWVPDLDLCSVFESWTHVFDRTWCCGVILVLPSMCVDILVVRLKLSETAEFKNAEMQSLQVQVEKRKASEEENKVDFCSCHTRVCSKCEPALATG